jgi:hypothetical protein
MDCMQRFVPESVAASGPDALPPPLMSNIRWS